MTVSVDVAEVEQVVLCADGGVVNQDDVVLVEVLGVQAGDGGRLGFGEHDVVGAVSCGDHVVLPGDAVVGVAGGQVHVVADFDGHAHVVDARVQADRLGHLRQALEVDAVRLAGEGWRLPCNDDLLRDCQFSGLIFDDMVHVKHAEQACPRHINRL